MKSKKTFKMTYHQTLHKILSKLQKELIEQDIENNTGLLAQDKLNTPKTRKSGTKCFKTEGDLSFSIIKEDKPTQNLFKTSIENWIEKENSYPHRIIIERKAEGFGRSNQFWTEVLTVRLKTEYGVQVKHTHRDVISDSDYEKILKILKKYENKNTC